MIMSVLFRFFGNGHLAPSIATTKSHTATVEGQQGEEGGGDACQHMSAGEQRLQNTDRHRGWRSEEDRSGRSYWQEAGGGGSLLNLAGHCGLK